MREIESPPVPPSYTPPVKPGVDGARVLSEDDKTRRELNKPRHFLNWMLTLARQKGSWSPRVVLGETWLVLVNIGTHRKILQLLKLKPFDEIARGNPRFAFKYVTPNYLARGFTVRERVSCFLHHYRRLHETFPEGGLRQILLKDLRIHEISNGANCFAITIGLPDANSRLEGELSLNLLINGKIIFGLSFTVVPGWVVRSDVAEILLVTRLQGAPGCTAEIKSACRAVYYYSPRDVLLATLGGIAETLAITRIEAIAAKMQRAYTEDRSEIFTNSYDNFFTEAGMSKTSTGFYSSPVPIEGRPLESYKGSAKWRAKKRRLMVQHIRLSCSQSLLGAADSSSRDVSSPPFSTPGEAVHGRADSGGCESVDG